MEKNKNIIMISVSIFVVVALALGLGLGLGLKNKDSYNDIDDGILNPKPWYEIGGMADPRDAINPNDVILNPYEDNSNLPDSYGSINFGLELSPTSTMLT